MPSTYQFAVLLLQSASAAAPTASMPQQVWTSADFPRPPAPRAATSSRSGLENYPVEAIKRHEQGKVVAGVVVGTDGYVKKCWIIETSSSVSLDKQTCRIALISVHYSPATDASGNPIESETRFPIRWVLPQK